jgi:hypothetical protein
MGGRQTTPTHARNTPASHSRDVPTPLPNPLTVAQTMTGFGRHLKRVNQSRLNNTRHFGYPRLVVTAFNNVDFGKRHRSSSVSMGRR